MTTSETRGDEAWQNAGLAAAILAVDPAGLGGACLRAPRGPVSDVWLDRLRELSGPEIGFHRLPPGIGEERLLGGLDLAATLIAGRAVTVAGLLHAANHGFLVAPMAERLDVSVAAHVAAALDTGQLVLERDGLTAVHPCRLGLILLDEGGPDDERPPAVTLERLAFQPDITSVRWREAVAWQFGLNDIRRAREGLIAIEAPEVVLEALCTLSMALAIPSLRAPILALRAARAAAALSGERRIGEEHALIAARLVLAPRARALPAETNQTEDSLDETPPSAEDQQSACGPEDIPRGLDDLIVEAAQAALPEGLLKRLLAGGAGPKKVATPGKSATSRRTGRRGRPAGTRRGEPQGGAKLALHETVLAAAPWQSLRHNEAQARGLPHHTGGILVRRDDFRVLRFRQKAASTTIFAVDASGSSAFHRLAEAKGAVELLLADCYVRRDRVALLAFRGVSAEMLLPPTRSLTRAKRCLAALPGGGGTPLAAGIAAACDVAEAVRRKGEFPIVVLMTDGRGNIDLAGQPGRKKARDDALAQASRLRAASTKAILIDISPRPGEQAGALAEAMGARYAPLPLADSSTVSRAVRALSSTGGSQPGRR